MTEDTTPLHMTRFVAPLLHYVSDRGAGADALLSASGISSRQLDGDDARVPFARIADLFERAADLLKDDCLGFHFGQTLEARDAGMIGYVGLSSASLFDTLLNLERYRRVYSDAVEVDTGRLVSDGLMLWEYKVPVTLAKRQFHEFAVTNLIHTLRDATNAAFRMPHVAFSHPRNTNRRAFERWFGGVVEFDAPRTVLRFGKHDLHLRVRSADETLLSILQTHCRRVLDTRKAETETLVHKVERLIADRLTSNRARLDTVAGELGMSGRTLTRRLQNTGHTFNGLLDDLRRDLAQTYLTDSDLTLSEIAYLLGYSEVSAFNHAYKRWTGATPSELRKSKA